MPSVPEIIAGINPKYSEKGKPKPVWQNHITYDSPSSTLEPIYFWILDLVENFGYSVEKVADNFSATPGSGYFAELGARATKMQEEGMKILGTVNTVIKSILNLIYDLKDFEIRLKSYESLKSKSKSEQEAGILSLKQVWMDKVDIAKGRGSINGMTAELGFTTLRDAFMAAKSAADVDKMDLNDRVKRVLKPRIEEFLVWIKASEQELKKRYEIERTYLKSQVESLKMYTRWAKPYLRAAEQLGMKESSSPHLVNVFNTMVLELSLFCKKKIEIKDSALGKELPLKFAEMKFKRDYYVCVHIDFKFRGMPQRVSQRGDYALGGRTDIDFMSFVLNDDELAKFQQELEKSDISDALKLVENVTSQSLAELQADLDRFINDKSSAQDSGKSQSDDVNPFSALFSFSNPEKKKSSSEQEKAKKSGIVKDSYAEGVVRNFAEKNSADSAYKIYELFKKSMGMAAFDDYDTTGKAKREF
ncbi:MAG: hypothetical protein V1886_01010 [archaeon]